MYCIYCGKKISDDSLFCVYCSAKQRLSNNLIQEDVILKRRQNKSHNTCSDFVKKLCKQLETKSNKNEIQYNRGTKYYFDSKDQTIWFFDKYLEQYDKFNNRMKRIDYDIDDKYDLYFNLKDIILMEHFVLISYYPYTLDKSNFDIVQFSFDDKKSDMATEIYNILREKIKQRQAYEEKNIKSTSCKIPNNKKSKKTDWNKKRNNFADKMTPCIIWSIGTESQQELADSLISNFGKRVSKYLCWALKDNIVDEVDVNSIVDNIYYAISDINDAKWWCNKKNSSDYKIALNLLDNDTNKESIKKIYEFYDHD